ncbi:MAG: glycosyltransferase, partial [Nitrospiraceae bacterium]|nr:glycosyltransferase [Nitrospiraceae bacterium]
SSVDALGSMEILNLKDVYHVKRNGKGAALRTGLKLGKGQYLGFIDADGDIDPKALSDFISVLIAFQPDIVLGSKRHPASEVVYPPLRRLYSLVYQQLIRRLFNLSVRDTQTGVKLCRREVIEQVLPLMVEKRFAFDLELFVVATRLGYDKFVEAPVIIRERFSSTVNMVSVAGTLLDTLAIFYRERILHFYDRMT